MYENIIMGIGVSRWYQRRPLLIFRLITIMLITSILQVSASTFAQRVTLIQKRISIEKLFREIHSQTGLSFLYDGNVVDGKRLVDINVTNETVENVLKITFMDQPVQYIIDGKTVVLKKREPASSAAPLNASGIIRPDINNIRQAGINISGMVTDTTGLAMPGVSVTAQGKKQRVSTQTGQKGEYDIDVEVGSALTFSFVGYKPQTLTVTANKKVYHIILHEDNALQDVVITAFGRKERKEALVGSVTSIKPADMKIPASNLTNALAGQAAGIIAYQRSGQPGQDNSAFFIRGVTTFGYKKDPLILIDNIELSVSDLARLQVDDIASFSILKDASATALYGARGANGVILVSTKEGKEGKATVNFRLENSFSQSANTIKLADPITYMNLFNEALLTRDSLALPKFTPNKILNTIATINKAEGSNEYAYPAVDWMALLFKKRTSTQRANLSVSGGGGVARYYVAGSYNLDNGILRSDDRNNSNTNVKFRNYQLRSNVNINLTKKTELVIRLSGNFSEYNGPLSADGGFSTDLYNIAAHTSPVLFPAYFPADFANRNAKHILFGNEGDPTNPNNIIHNNPYAQLLRGHKNSSESRMSAQLELNQDLDVFTKGLSFRSIFNTNRYSYFDSQRQYSPYYYNVQANSYNKLTNTYTLQWLNSDPNTGTVPTEYLNYNGGGTSLNTFLYFQGALNYDRKFGNHNISSTLIGTAQQTLNANAGSLLSSLPYRNIGLAGRLTYAYKSKYFIETNFGYNGSERFSENHRYGFFPTIGGSWILSQEGFWEDLKSVADRVKLRASFGLVGNDAIGSQRFFYLSDVNLNGGKSATFGTNNSYTRNGVSINNYSNYDVTWETSRQTNLALELTLFKSLNIVAEAYDNYRYNILMNRASISSIMGLEAGISANLGKVRSRGLDLSMDYKKSFSNGISAAVRSNFTFVSNKYVNYEEPEWPEDYRYVTGQGLGRRVGLVAERLFVDDKEAKNSPSQIFSANGRPPKGGDIKYRDLNNDGKINDADRTSLGYSQDPEMVYGVGFSASFRNFDLSAFFQGQARMSFFIDPERTSPFVPSPDGNIRGNTQLIKDFADNHWSEDNQDLYALYPRLAANREDLENNRQISTWWMRDGSFIRLKSLEIGFTLPKNIARKLLVGNARLYFNGLNLITWSKFKMWDPELGGNGFSYPLQKVFNVGVNVNL